VALGDAIRLGPASVWLLATRPPQAATQGDVAHLLGVTGRDGSTTFTIRRWGETFGPFGEKRADLLLILARAALRGRVDSGREWLEPDRVAAQIYGRMATAESTYRGLLFRLRRTLKPAGLNALINTEPGRIWLLLPEWLEIELKSPR